MIKKTWFWGALPEDPKSHPDIILVLAVHIRPWGVFAYFTLHPSVILDYGFAYDFILLHTHSYFIARADVFDYVSAPRREASS